MNVQMTAKRLGKSEATIRRWIREGKLSATKVDGVYDIPESEINGHSERTNERQMTDVLNEQIEYLKERIKVMEDESERKDTIILQLTRQLENTQLLLEDNRKSWIKRLFRRSPKD